MNSLIKRYFNLPNDELSSLFPDRSSKLHLFGLINRLISREYIYKGKLLIIFKERFGFYENQPVRCLREIGEQFELTRERIRQLAVKIKKKFAGSFRFICYFDIKKIEPYKTLLLKDIIYIDDAFAAEFNLREKCEFSKLFYFEMLKILFADTHAGFVSMHNKRYLLNSCAADIFDFGMFVESIGKIIKQANSWKAKIRFDTFLRQFYRPDNPVMADRVSKICEKLLLYEFNISLDNKRNIIPISINSRLYACIYYVLELSGRPMKGGEIFEEINKRFPGKCRSSLSVASTAVVNDLFITFSRTGTYGLKIWEGQFPDIKGGTIRNMAFEYLDKADNMVNIYELEEYINKYRTTKAKYIKANLFLDKRFYCINNRYFGIRGKQYKSLPSAVNRVKGYFTSKKYLKKYTGKTPEEIADIYSVKFGYAASDVLRILKMKIQKGDIMLEDNKLYLKPEAENERV